MASEIESWMYDPIGIIEFIKQSCIRVDQYIKSKIQSIILNLAKEVEYTDNIIYTKCSRKYNIVIAYRVNNKRSFFSFSRRPEVIRTTSFESRN